MGSFALLAVILVIVGALIAYIGDRLGTFVGKKRLSKFGLRPRHTAILYTTVTGGVIPFLTLVVFFNLSHEFHQAITEGVQLVTKNRHLEARNSSLARQIDDAQVVASKYRAEADANSALASLNARKAQVFSGKLDSEIVRYNVQIALDERKLAGEQSSLEEARDTLAAARLELDSTQRDLIVTQSQGKVADDQWRDAEAKLKTAHTKVADAEQMVSERQREVDRLNHQYQTLIALNDSLQRHTAALETQTNIHTGDEIGRIVIPTSDSPSEIKERLTTWLDALSQTAADRGAGSEQDGRNVIVEGDGSEQSGQAIPEGDSIDTLTQRISIQSAVVGSVVVVAEARYNSTVGEPVRLDLHPYDNILVFSKGEVVARTTVDGQLPQKQVMDQLVSFVRAQVLPVAHERSIMPTVDPKTNEKTYGQADHLLDSVADVEASGAVAEVDAVAKEDIYTEGPLDVELRVVAPDKQAAASPAESTGTEPTRSATPVLSRSGAGQRPSAVTGL